MLAFYKHLELDPQGSKLEEPVSVREVKDSCLQRDQRSVTNSFDCVSYLQGDGENEKRLVRIAGGLPETPDLQETVNGTETKIVMKMRKTVNLTEREILIEMIVSGVPGLTSLFKYFWNVSV